MATVQSHWNKIANLGWSGMFSLQLYFKCVCVFESKSYSMRAAGEIRKINSGWSEIIYLKTDEQR